MTPRSTLAVVAGASFALISTLSGCDAKSGDSNGDTESASLRGNVRIDGSSTVYPITEAVAEAFAEVEPDVRVTVGISGTGGGFKRFTVGETDISDASRPIKAKELDAANANGVAFIEVPVAYDGLTIVVNKANDWATDMTVDELKKIFLEGESAMSWNDVRADWPDRPIKIFAPGTDSGTFDYFKEVVAGKTGSIRSDMSVSEDDNVLVRGVEGDAGAIGFFGCAYFFENEDKLRAVSIVNPELGTPIAPSATTIEDGSYAPFSRPLFIYVADSSLDGSRPEVSRFVEFYLEKAGEMAELVGYVRLPNAVYEAAAHNVHSRKTGTQFLVDGEKAEGPVTLVYKAMD